MSDLFYLQDSRSYVGNAVVWWRRDAQGYTTDPSEAHVFTRAEADRAHALRATDIPWPKDYIDQRAISIVDAQHVELSEALRQVAASECPGRGECHGSMAWCDVCGDVSATCPEVECDLHHPVDSAGVRLVPGEDPKP